MGFEFFQEHELSDSPEYRSVLHELRDEHDNQMMVIHMDVHQFSPSAMRRMIREFAALRSCTDATIFAIEPTPDDGKWHRYVSLIGFGFSSHVECTDGLTRRCYVSKKKNNNDVLKHFPDAEQPALVRSAALPDASVRTGIN